MTNQNDAVRMLPLPVTNYNGCGDGSEPLWTEEQMIDYASACVEASANVQAEKVPAHPAQGDTELSEAQIVNIAIKNRLRYQTNESLVKFVADIRAVLQLAAMSVELHDFENDPSQLWAEIHRLRADQRGPAGFTTWRDAAVDERLRRVAAEGKLEDISLQSPASVDVQRDAALLTTDEFACCFAHC